MQIVLRVGDAIARTQGVGAPPPRVASATPREREFREELRTFREPKTPAPSCAISGRLESIAERFTPRGIEFRYIMLQICTVLRIKDGQIGTVGRRQRLANPTSDIHAFARISGIMGITFRGRERTPEHPSGVSLWKPWVSGRIARFVRARRSLAEETVRLERIAPSMPGTSSARRLAPALSRRIFGNYGNRPQRRRDVYVSPRSRDVPGALAPSRVGDNPVRAAISGIMGIGNRLT